MTHATPTNSRTQRSSLHLRFYFTGHDCTLASVHTQPIMRLIAQHKCWRIYLLACDRGFARDSEHLAEFMSLSYVSRLPLDWISDWEFFLASLKFNRADILMYLKEKQLICFQ